MSNINLQIFSPGSLVDHPAYGYGRVLTTAQDGRSVVRFEGSTDSTIVQTSDLLLRWKPINPKWLKSLASAGVLPYMRTACDSLRSYTPGVGGKRGEQRYIENSAINDHSYDHESHNSVGGDTRKDLDATEHAEWQHDRTVSVDSGSERTDKPEQPTDPFKLDDMAEPEEGESVTLPIDEAATITLTRSVDAVTLTIPLTPLRDLKQRTSKRQRRLLRAFDLWRRGHDWDAVAKITGENRDTIRGYRTQIKAMLGEAVLVRERGYQPKDPWTNQFVQYTVQDVGREKNM
jgi:hypothetical protein